MKIDIAAREIRNAEGGDDRFVGDVLKPLESQLDLKLRLCIRDAKKRAHKGEPELHRAAG
jgi:hypothetical protein